MDETGHATAAIVILLSFSVFRSIQIDSKLIYRNEKEREKEAKWVSAQTAQTKE